MVISVVANIVNAALAMVLVFGLGGAPQMGVAGAGWATAAAGTVEGLLYFGVFLWGKASRAHGSRDFKMPGRQSLKQFLGLGLPIGMTWMFEMVAWTAFAAYASTRAPVELAAHMVLFQVTGFCFMPAVAIGVAASTLVGQYLGAKRPDLAWRSGWRALVLGVGYMTSIGLAIIVLRVPLVRAFNPDPAVVLMGSTLGVLAGSYQPFDGFGIISQAILRGAGKTAAPTAIMLGSGMAVFIPLVWFFGEKMQLGIRGAWGAALAHVTVTAIVLGIIVFQKKWLRAKLLIQAEDVLSTPLSERR
jgi:MATE family multidrug resistance protein